MEEKSDKSTPEKEITDKDVEEWFKKKFSDEWSKDKNCCKSSGKNKMYKTGASGGAGVYCLGFIGALVYYIGAATGFWVGVLGVLKAIVWPAMVVYGILGLIG
jgi:hypothetical protein